MPEIECVLSQGKDKLSKEIEKERILHRAHLNKLNVTSSVVPTCTLYQCFGASTSEFSNSIIHIFKIGNFTSN